MVPVPARAAQPAAALQSPSSASPPSSGAPHVGAYARAARCSDSRLMIVGLDLVEGRHRSVFSVARGGDYPPSIASARRRRPRQRECRRFHGPRSSRPIQDAEIPAGLPGGGSRVLAGEATSPLRRGRGRPGRARLLHRRNDDLVQMHASPGGRSSPLFRSYSLAPSASLTVDWPPARGSAPGGARWTARCSASGPRSKSSRRSCAAARVVGDVFPS